MNKKQCKKCFKFLEVNEENFSIRNQKINNKIYKYPLSYCKICEKKYRKEYREKNKEKNKKYRKEYRENNIEKYKKYQKEYRKKNIEKYKKYQKEYREKIKNNKENQ